MELRRTAITLGDGRSLEVAIAGPADETAVLMHHGTPSALVTYRPFVEAVLARGLGYVSYSRPGYGGSDRLAGRTVADCASDVAQLANALGVRRILSVGWSGGGPHALACAALLPERVAAAATIAGAAPYDADGLDFLAGMAPENVEEFGDALAGPDRLVAFLEREVPKLSVVTPQEVADAFGQLVSEVDRASLTGEFAEFIAEGSRAAVRAGFWGWYDDDMAFVRPWGFDLADIRVPVSVWQGRHDRMVPFAHGAWLAAHVPGARAHLRPEHGHLSLAVGSFAEIVDDLIASTEDR